MVTPHRTFLDGELYHLMGRGVEKRDTFLDVADYDRFLHSLIYYQQEDAPIKFSDASFRLLERQPPLRYHLIAYCLMPNHFHLLVQQLCDGGIHDALRHLLTSYSKYFNTRYQRVGPLWQGRFKSVHIETDEQLVHVFRYILLNPFVSRLTEDPMTYQWSSAGEYFGSSTSLCEQKLIQDQFRGLTQLKQFVLDHADYARSLELSKHLVLE